jgi:phage terminase large subunit GpA-like protein
MALENDPKRPPRNPITQWQVNLFIGSAHKTGELYGRPKQVAVDEAGKALAVPVYERALNVYQIKRIIAKRMKVEDGPGQMHTPYSISDRYLRELTSERLINDEWTPSGRNETWDGWVACEAARAIIQPDRAGLWAQTPEWAAALPRDARNIDQPKTISYYARLAALNRGDESEDDDGGAV